LRDEKNAETDSWNKEYPQISLTSSFLSNCIIYIFGFYILLWKDLLESTGNLSKSNLELVFSLAAIFVLSWRCRDSSGTSVLVVGNDHSSRFMGDIFAKFFIYCD
jgi:hypothetical protein